MQLSCNCYVFLYFIRQNHYVEILQMEEEEIFPQLEDVLSAEQLKSMGKLIERLKPLAPTCSHPHAPNTLQHHDW